MKSAAKLGFLSEKLNLKGVKFLQEVWRSIFKKPKALATQTLRLPLFFLITL